jgi:hypothetical protein
VITKIPIMTPSAFSRRAQIVGIFVWFAVVSAGLLTLVAHSNAPGAVTTLVDAGRVVDGLSLSTDEATQVMFAHPRCPCSQSSMRELARILTECPSAVQVQIWFYCPDDEPDDWAHTELWELASHLATFEPRIDRDGRAAAQCGVQTSGHALLFEPSGELVYSGGLTSSRGHEGDSLNSQALGRLLRGESNEIASFPVFGCPIHTSR